MRDCIDWRYILMPIWWLMVPAPTGYDHCQGDDPLTILLSSIPEIRTECFHRPSLWELGIFDGMLSQWRAALFKRRGHCSVNNNSASDCRLTGTSLMEEKLCIDEISNRSILNKFDAESSCLDIRRLASLHGVGADDHSLGRAIADLLRRGRIRCIGGRGRRASYVLASFER